MATTRKQATAPGRRRLGKGLGSLISTPTKVDVLPDDDGPVSGLPLDSVHPNPAQPRKHFDEQSLDALAASIRSAGVMQPIVVRTRQGGGYELVAGERRWRAAQRAGLKVIPAVVREANDRQAAELSLIENLQREDLNPIERGEAFRRLINDFGLKHQDVGDLVGMDRSSVTNHLRLLELDDQIQEVVRMGLLGLGHARALLSLKAEDERRRLALKAAREGWSVRATEREIGRRVRRSGAAGPEEEPPRPISPRQAHLADLERRLSEHLGTRVRIRPGKKKGTGSLVVEFYDTAQFEGLVQRLGFKLD
ncbi:MAG: ParB/RepB/Spo0J family partition protein [Planctomycetota bacterium]|jgi:ParB family chromosome partitioning protein